jgi:hypothetical protein
MKQRQLELALKKQILLLDCASQRQQFAQHAAGLQPIFSGTDRTIEAVHWLKQHPLAIAAGSAALFVLRPRFLLRWGTRGLSLWRLAQTLRGRL